MTKKTRMRKNKIIKKKSTKVLKNKTSESDWTTSEDNKLLALYKRNVPEFALSKILKKSISQIRERVILLIKKSNDVENQNKNKLLDFVVQTKFTEVLFLLFYAYRISDVVLTFVSSKLQRSR